MDLQQRSAIVTGGAGGLGSATARHLVGAGMRVVVFDRDGEHATQLADELGDGAAAVSGDTTDDGDVGAAIEAATGLGTLSVLVNVAGGGVGGGRTVGRDGTPHDRDAFVKTMDMNVLGTFNVSRLVASAMAANEPDDQGERGVIVNTASVAAFDGQIGQLAYSASKGAVVGMTLPAARDLASIGVRVVTIAPGLFDTPLLGMLPEEQRNALGQSVLFPKKLGQPIQYGQLVAHIAQNSYLNAEVIRLDGGIRMPPK
jgi:NAD(P)-dependent dehydrogenase (short-subunit alcohol dehydrogenase family)